MPDPQWTRAVRRYPAISWGRRSTGCRCRRGPCRTRLAAGSSCHRKANLVNERMDDRLHRRRLRFGPWMSCDYYAIIGAHERAISGRVLTKHGKPVNGATITIDGPTGGPGRRTRTATTTPISSILGGTRSMRAEGVRDPASFCSGHEARRSLRSRPDAHRRRGRVHRTARQARDALRPRRSSLTVFRTSRAPST